MSLIQQHRLVNEALKPYLQDGRLHALALRTFTPSQWEELQGADPGSALQSSPFPPS
ncbi:BolA family transcriptional regulator [Synechococcus sp. O70.2]